MGLDKRGVICYYSVVPERKLEEELSVINSIIERNRRISPLSEREKKIIASAVKLFLQNGYSNTTIKMISEDCGIRQGTIVYHYHTKEDMLKHLIEELMDYHSDVIEDTNEETGDELFSYAMEIAVQIALCENDRKAWDIYYSAYSNPQIFGLIKDWAAKKNYMLLKNRLPDWSESDFRHIENATSGIELAALMSPCNRYYSLEDKIVLTLDSMLKIYEVAKSERDATVEKIKGFDYEKTGKNLFDKFVSRLNIEEEK